MFSWKEYVLLVVEVVFEVLVYRLQLLPHIALSVEAIVLKGKSTPYIEVMIV